MIYDMLFDNIQLRVKQNKLSSRILTQANLNIDKMVTGYFRKNHKMINGAIELSSLKFRTKLQEQITKRPIRTWRQVATDWHGALMSHQH